MINSFDTLKSNDSIYIFDSRQVVNCVDCDYAFESQLCYEGTTIAKCFNSEFLEDCTNINNSSYCYNCRNGGNLFGCVNLTGKSFCIFNRQLTEAEYKEQVKKYKAWPPEKALKMLEELKKKYPVTQTKGENNVNSPYGNYIYNSKNCYMDFDSAGDENCGYLYDSGGNKNSYDATFSGDSELSYEFIDSTKLFNCNFVIWAGHSSDCSYIMACGNSKHLLGCVGLYQKEYCILNRQFTKEEYEQKSKQILEELKQKNLGWGNIKV
ncbi:MAG TPA: hypothetical protein VLF68_01640 [Candidatus Saccharimonadales bacterium]|nr:hypothetical protein [Candidatus Saccharimonadales bacterium]